MAADLVGFTGIAGSGKDTAAQCLVGYTHLAFADKLKIGALAVDPLIPVGPDAYGQYSFVRLSKLVAELGWDEAKKNPEVRRFLQRYGTEGGREIHGDDCWLKPIKKSVQYELSESRRVKITDVRNDNEADLVGYFKGCLIRVVGPRRIPGVDSSHSSEKGISDTYVSWNVVNDGTIPDLHTKILYCVDQGYQKTTQTI